MKEPRFWSGRIDPKSREAAPLMRFVLTPFACAYGAVTAARIKSAKPLKVQARVICVGNLTAGGVGKSPVVMALRSFITERTNLRAATLSRGYRGQLKGPVKVNANTHTAAAVGDEPAMLALSGESWIGAARDEAGLAMSADGVEVILMDDGHQNPSLAKDLSLVVIDSFDPFGNGHVIPKGPLREPIQAGLARADAVVIMGDEAVPQIVRDTKLPVLRARITPTTSLPTGPLVAFAGIGRPVKFFDTLKTLGGDIRDAVPFPDHHTYSGRELDYLKKLAGDHGATLITTEKDYARLGKLEREAIATLPVEARFDDETLLDNLLAPVLKPEA